MRPHSLALTFLIVAFIAIPSLAQTDEESELQSLLREETELATRTRMNHDFVPGMVTVLQGTELRTLGVRTVWEALSLVPGVQSVRDLYASPLVLVRGINFIFNSGNIKILVDSVPLNQESAGINSSILMMPIEEVERIEFMRGPGSAIQGDFAYLGLVNIITRRDGSGAFVSFAEAGLLGGARYTSFDAARDRQWGVAASGLSTNDIDGAGPTRNREKKGFGRFFWRQRGFRFTLHAIQSDRSDDESGDVFTENRFSAEGRYAREVSPALHLEANAGVLQNDDHIGAKQFDGRSMHAGLDARWTAPHGHNVLLSLSGLRSEIHRGSLFLVPLFAINITDLQRRTASLAVQDQWNVTDRLTLTGGIRYDDLSDVGSRTTSRVAVVWRIDEHQILKSQFAQGFRSPGFWELYQTGGVVLDVESETIDTTELSYILHRDRFVARATLFHSDLDEMIQPPFVPGGSFSNAATARTRGVELEWTQTLSQTTHTSANLSWADPDDGRFTRDVLAASEWLANVTLTTKLAQDIQFAARWNHVGERFGETDGYDVLDLTATRTQNAFTFRGGVKNAFDDRVTYLTTLPPPVDPIQQRFGGRAWWAEVAYRF